MGKRGDERRRERKKNKQDFLSLAFSQLTESFHTTERSQGQTYIRLDELTALLSYPGDEAEHVQTLLYVHHVDHGVDDDKGPGPPHPRTEGRDRRRGPHQHLGPSIKYTTMTSDVHRGTVYLSTTREYDDML